MKQTTSVMNILRSAMGIAVAGVMIGHSADVVAYQKGDVVLRAGIALAEPNESSDPIEIQTLNLGAAGNAQVGVGTDVQLGLTASYMLTDQIGIELLAATPFNHDIYGAGDIAGIGKLAEATHLPPTLSVQYYFNDPQSKFQPYVGVGVNYTIFFDEDVSSTLDNPGTFNALANLAGAGLAANDFTAVSGTDIELDDSIGIAFEIGIDIALTEALGINLAYWRVDMDTTADISTTATSTALGVTPINASVDVEIDPSVYMAGLYYKF